MSVTEPSDAVNVEMAIPAEERRLTPSRQVFAPQLDLWWVGCAVFLLEFLTLEGGTERLSRNVGKKLPLLAA